MRTLNLEYVGTSLEECLHIEKLISFHYYQYAPTYIGLLEKHDFWELVYVDCGRVICNAGGKEFKLTAGDAILHPPMEEHAILAPGSNGNACIFSFECPKLDSELFRGRVIPFSKFERDLISNFYVEGRRTFEPPYNALVQSQIECRANIPYGALQILRNTLEILIISLIRNIMANPSVARDENRKSKPFYRSTHVNAEKIVNDVVAYLQKNICNHVTIDDLCRETAFSRSRLQEVFRSQMQQSIIHYFNSLKIERAKELIAEEQYSFTQIAGMLGFGSVHYFSRIFRKFTHMSPREYESSMRITNLR